MPSRVSEAGSGTVVNVKESAVGPEPHVQTWVVPGVMPRPPRPLIVVLSQVAESERAEPEVYPTGTNS